MADLFSISAGSLVVRVGDERDALHFGVSPQAPSRRSEAMKSSGKHTK